MHTSAYLRGMEQIRRKTPLARAIWELGGKVSVAMQLGVHRNTVASWAANDRVPTGRQTALLDLAQRNGIELKAEDLIG